MQPFTIVTGAAAALPSANIDTDVIMPKQFLKGIDRAGLRDGAFFDLRFSAPGQPRPDFVLNKPEWSETRFLVVGPNFGCGSSREHAVWGLLQFGIRAIIGTSFAGIFADNAANNGLLLVTLADQTIALLADRITDRPTELCIDLERRSISGGGLDIAFEIDDARRRAMMLGLDRIGETLTHADDIRTFQQAYLASAPWLLAGAGE